MVIALIQWITFCRTKVGRSRITNSCGNIGLDGAEPTFKNNDPLLLRIRCTSAVHLRLHSKYDSRASVSEYFPYLIPRLYGGEVTVTSTQASGSRDIPETQSSRRRSWEKNENSSCPTGSLIRTINMVRTTLPQVVQKKFKR